MRRFPLLVSVLASVFSFGCVGTTSLARVGDGQKSESCGWEKVGGAWDDRSFSFINQRSGAVAETYVFRTDAQSVFDQTRLVASFVRLGVRVTDAWIGDNAAVFTLTGDSPGRVARLLIRRSWQTEEIVVILGVWPEGSDEGERSFLCLTDDVYLKRD